MSSYAHVLDKTNGRASKRIANNTYAVRLRETATNEFREMYAGESGLQDPDAVGIRLHQTVVVLYTKDGRLRLDSGGWRTVTSKSRINDWSPNWVGVRSEKGEWRVYPQGWSGSSVPFADGVMLEINSLAGTAWTPVPGTFPSEDDETLRKRAKRKTWDEIDVYLQRLPEKIAEWQRAETMSTAGDPWCCSMFKDESKDHLWLHLREGYIFPSIVFAAYGESAYGKAGEERARRYAATHVSMGMDDLVKKIVRNYLRKALEPLQRPSADDLLLSTYLPAAREVVEKPSDYAYFGKHDLLYVTHGPTWTRTRDSENLDIANFEIVRDALKAEFPDLWAEDQREVEGEQVAIYVMGSSHWAVGWIDQIVVPVLQDKERGFVADNLHPAFVKVCEFNNQRGDYPALDGAEERAAELDAEDEFKAVKQYLAESADDSAVRTLVSYLHDEHGDVWSPGADDFYRAIRHLDLEPAEWVLRYAPKTEV